MTAVDESDVLILGGGAAGLFCAANAAQRGLRVQVLERAGKPGKKILMSGGGRCNFTNLHTTPEQFISANPHFCKSALARFTPQDFLQWVERHRIAWHEKELGQLFCNESSKQILRMLLDECAEAGVTLQCGVDVQQVGQDGDGFAVRTAGATLRGRRLVIATGGLSVPSLGGSSLGYALAQQFGHRLVPMRAGLVPLTLSGRPLEHWQDLAGLSLPVCVRSPTRAFTHAMLITHRGLSGPALLQVSSYWEPGQPLQIDLLPHDDAEALLLRARSGQPAAELRKVLGEVLPRRFAQRFCELLAPSRPMRQWRQAELRDLAKVLHHWPVTPSGTEGYRTAEVTLGGVDTDQVSSGTLESRRVPGLHFIGEVLDVSGWLGGYNFQWAWASAHACAQALGEPR